MIVGNKNAAVASFKLSINHNLIEETDNVKYLGVYLDNKLSCKIRIDKLTRKLSKVCGVTYKLRHYVPFSTLNSVLCYASVFGQLGPVQMGPGQMGLGQDKWALGQMGTKTNGFRANGHQDKWV